MNLCWSSQVDNKCDVSNISNLSIECNPGRRFSKKKKKKEVRKNASLVKILQFVEFLQV